MARIRYKSPAVEAQLSLEASPSSNDFDVNTINFTTPVWGVTPGQSLVIYKDNLVVGGGIIQ
jgi:tRNA U34 2-thiouridine synthase MnmA/TrmU